MTPNRFNLPVVAAAFAALVFGLWWIPIRYLESLGLHGSWAGMSLNLAATIVGGAWIVLRKIRFDIPRRALLGAVLAGAAAMLYSSAIAHTDVVRAVLLFYLLPAWSKLIERVFWGQPWRWTSTLAVCAALFGAFLVLGGKVGGGALNFGDIIAIVSGLCWAAGAALIFSSGRAAVFPITWVTVLSATLVAIPFLYFEPWPTITLAAPAITTGMAILYILPLLALSLWSAQRLAPAVFSFLLTGEILSGVISSAILLDEPFGLMQVAGTVLIVIAALSEIFSRQDVGELPLHSPKKSTD